jgi:transposase
MIEGGVDSTLYENFIYHTLMAVRTDKTLCKKKVVLFMDNATIHKAHQVMEIAKKMKVILVYNAEYSSWLNPIEQYFRHLKS